MRSLNQKKRPVLVITVFVLLMMLGACSLPAEDNEVSSQTAVALTVEAALPTEDLSKPTPTPPPASDEDTDSSDISPTSIPTDTPLSTEIGDEDDTDIGEDRAEFVADVTIPDYSQHRRGDEITKTWRIRNIGETSWTTDYYLEFEKGERLGASTIINLSQPVDPNDFVDLSIDFTVPNATGEYASYWVLKNEDGQRVGVEEEGKFLTLFMIILSVDEVGGGDDGDGGDGGNGSSSGIAGGAKITNATVSVDDPNYSGDCPAQITFTYTVTTSNAGRVNFYLDLGVISPSGYTFDPTPEYDLDFNSGYTVTYNYTLFSSSSVSATAKVVAVGENSFNSTPVNFSINCE